jgi:anti-sigma regulatory factor (Ser/Thr protein kinase)
MGLSELLVNGVEHGNLGIDFAEKSRLREADCWEEEVARRLALDENRGKSVRLRVRGDDSRWTFEIHDDGPGFDWRRFLDFDPERAFAPNGRGIALSRQLSFASLTYLPPGNQVVVTVAKPERHAS